MGNKTIWEWEEDPVKEEVWIFNPEIVENNRLQGPKFVIAFWFLSLFSDLSSWNSPKANTLGMKTNFLTACKLVPIWWLTQPEDSATRESTYLCSLPFHLYYDFSIFHLLRQSVLQGSGKKNHEMRSSHMKMQEFPLY